MNGPDPTGRCPKSRPSRSASSFGTMYSEPNDRGKVLSTTEFVIWIR